MRDDYPQVKILPSQFLKERSKMKEKEDKENLKRKGDQMNDEEVKLEPPYWIGKCELCEYASDFSTSYGLVWHCDKYDKPMSLIKSCAGPYRDKESLKKLKLK